MYTKKTLFLPGFLIALVCASLACRSVGLVGNSIATAQAGSQAQGADPDHDGIPADTDQCPDEPENHNGIFDTNGCPDTIQDLVGVAGQDIDQFWQKEFAGSPVSYISPNAVSAYSDAQPLETACGETIPDNAFYCPLDNSIYYDVGLLQKILRAKSFGDFAVVTVIAHEWGHLVQADLHITHGDVFNIELELQADCFAGAYGRYLAQGNSQLSLDQGDLEEGTKVLYALGDTQTPWFDPQAHGTPQQRRDAYLLGLNKGTTGCITQ
jgi:predicted metalloprotease